MFQNSPNLSQQSLNYPSSESLPPPPAYLLDSSGSSQGIIEFRHYLLVNPISNITFLVPGNVAGTVKALNESRHTPASPNLLRRAQNIINQHQQVHIFNNLNLSSIILFSSIIIYFIHFLFIYFFSIYFRIINNIQQISVLP